VTKLPPGVLDFISHSPGQTQRLGARLAAHLEPGDQVLLEGTLGSGKTVFAQGVAQGLGITEPVTSPSFTLIREYREGRLPLFHIDLYRIGSLAEVEALGLEEYLLDAGVALVEWPDRAMALFPPYRLEVHLSIVAETKRDVRLEPYGQRYHHLLTAFKRDAFGL